MSGGYSFTTTQGVCEMKKQKTGYLLLCLILVVLLAACQASYVREVSGGNVNTNSPILFSNQTTIK
nr:MULTISPECIES: colicin release lysis protein [Gammaproteobacteria]